MLYEVITQGFIRRVPDRRGLADVADQTDHLVFGHAETRPRTADDILFVITSYSIHYTKLYEERSEHLKMPTAMIMSSNGLIVISLDGTAVLTAILLIWNIQTPIPLV